MSHCRLTIISLKSRCRLIRTCLTAVSLLSHCCLAVALSDGLISGELVDGEQEAGNDGETEPSDDESKFESKYDDVNFKSSSASDVGSAPIGKKRKVSATHATTESKQILVLRPEGFASIRHLLKPVNLAALFDAIHLGKTTGNHISYY